MGCHTCCVKELARATLVRSGKAPWAAASPLVRKVSIPALARGCPTELAVLDLALRGTGYFLCETLELSEKQTNKTVQMLDKAYEASRSLHSREPHLSRWIQRKPCEPGSAGSSACLRSWHTFALGRHLPEESEQPGFVAAVGDLDAYLAGVASVLARAVTSALSLSPVDCLADSPSMAMLRGLRYPEVVVPISEEVADKSELRFGILPHVDFGDFTLCHSENGGLEVWERETHTWQSLPARQLCFLVGT
ncbi:unnamed protein product [Polarella glacialis]|uniref:Uncharacterized protein n=1 Tax=Polarella glacialis TaxID=89957 RepID=A0A813EAL3_POLGL|nr:unnamed protein product [Polarella glacialis]CAE8739000.1 unnamed protein product [Polarella glacialis]